MAATEPSQRGMIRHLIRCDHPERDIIRETLLDPTTGALSYALRIQEYPEHHLRVIRSTPTAVNPQRPVEARHVQLGDHIDDEPGQMISRQPIRQRRRHQQLIPLNTTHIHHARIMTKTATERENPQFMRQPPQWGCPSFRGA